MLRRCALLLLSSLLGMSSLAAVPPHAAAAGEGRDIGLEDFRDIVVDDTHGRVFISQGTDQLVVTDLDGNPTGVVEGLHGASGLALTEDDAVLYVGMATGDAIGIVDTATLAVDTVATGPQTCPERLALTAGLVWFTQSCGTEGIGAFDPLDRSVHLGISDLQDASILAGPARPDELFVGSQGTTYAFTAIGGETPALSQRLVRGSWGAGELALSPDGSTLLTLVGLRAGEATALSTADFSNAGSYRTAGTQPMAVAVRDDGMVAVGAGGHYDPDVFVMPPGSTTAMRTYETGMYRNVAYGGMAFGDTRLYVISGITYQQEYLLKVINPRRVSRVSVHPDRTTYGHGDLAEVSVELEGGETNRDVSVWATPIGQEPVLVSTGPVPLGGTFTARYEVTRTTTFSATYAGDAAYDDAEDAAKPIKVGADLRTRLLKPEGMSGKYHLYSASRRAVIEGVMPPRVEGRCLTFRVQYLVRGSWGYDGKTACLDLDRRARAIGYTSGDPDLVGMSLRMHAEFRGDKVNGATTSPWLYFRFTR